SYTHVTRVTGEEDFQAILTSDDKGLTWTKRAESKALQGRLFNAGGKLYYLATGKNLPIQVSVDNGETWSEIHYLKNDGKSWHQTAANTWTANGNIYLTMEQVKTRINAWNVAERMSFLMRAKLTDDLTKPQSWTYSSAMAFADVVPGVRENNPDTEYFGMPFYPQDYPNRYCVVPQRTFSPMGWVESNVIQIKDATHYWYDPTGHTFHVFSRFHSGNTNYAGLTKVVEKADGTMEMQIETAPSGKKMVMLPFPGGQMRFHILYDEQTELYWLLSTQSFDSMKRAELLERDRYDLAFNERQRLVLHFSKNMVDWCFAGLVAKERALNGSRHYACMDFDGDDIIILSRSGDYRAQSAHNGNLITFHRIENFRQLIY
ncbi:MAG: exo-alpha-sialidase, partial [Porphyromonadaceae bacterium]|nr:exo-alpha-sialidase [Porphyromonadaceae bacterium]